MAPKSGNSEIFDWQLECWDLKQRSAHLLRSGDLSDCSFVVDAERQVLVRAHKLILAMASPVFEAMFYGSMPEGNKPIAILDVEPEAFKALVKYIYTDEIYIHSIDAACDLYYGAKKYMLPHLIKECVSYLWSNINPFNACRIYVYANMIEEDVLVEKCLQVIGVNIKQILRHSSFKDIDYDMIKTIFSLDYLHVDSELDLFEAVVRYARVLNKEPKKKKVVSEDSSADTSPEASDAESEGGSEAGAAEPEGGPEAGAAESEGGLPGPNEHSENSNKQAIRGLIEKIRFLTLTPKQFADGPAQSELLTQAEIFALIMLISSQQSNMRLPPGFNASREPRKKLTGAGFNKKQITISESLKTFIYQEFCSLGIRFYYPPVTVWGSRSSTCSCSCSLNADSDYSEHYFVKCPDFAISRLGYEIICRVFKIDPFSEDVKGHSSTRKALNVFLREIKAGMRK